MKKIIFLIAILCFISEMKAQSLIEIYKQGTINLTPDTDYAKNTNWNKNQKSRIIIR